MTLAALLARLAAVEAHDGYHKARCPAHEDREASLSVRQRGGKLALHCFAGCADTAILEALGLTVRDLFRAGGVDAGVGPPRTPPAAAANAPRVIVATYDYRDEAGDLLYQNVRLEPKRFFQRRPHPDRPGEWINGLGAGWYERRRHGDWRKVAGGTDDPEVPPGPKAVWFEAGRRVLYRLRELRQALRAAPATPVLYVEGEKDCDRAWAEGCLATTHTAGAKSFSPFAADYVAQLQWAGVRELVLVPDHDVAGRTLMREIGQAVQAAVQA